MKRTLLAFTAGLALLCAGHTTAHAQNCGFDFYVANDQSGSVDAAEDKSSREFIVKLAQTHPLGNANDRNRVALAEWDQTFIPYVFANAGTNFSTDIADMIAYQNAARTIAGSTDVYRALLKAFQNKDITPIPGRTARKIIFLLTDASPGQVSSNIIPLASMIKATGTVIVVMAVGEAANITTLQGSNVASDASLYFSAVDYAALQNNATATVASMMSALCSNVLPPVSWDLKANINTLDCGTGTVNYTVENISPQGFNNTISTAFYDGDPAYSATKLLATDVRTSQNLTGGGTLTFTFTDPSLQLKSRIWAVVNMNAGNAITPLPNDLSPRLAIAGEQNPYNNIAISPTATGCSINLVLQVSNTLKSISCDKTLTYEVSICNQGASTATGVMPSFIPGNPNLVPVSIAGTSGIGKTVAQYAHPGGDVMTSGYDGYQSTPLYPCASNDITTPCAIFRYKMASGSQFIANAVFSFPPVSNGSGVPQGATILSARLTAKTGAVGYISGIKLPNVPKFDSTHHPGDIWTNNPTTDTAKATGSVVDVTRVVQELVNQPSWSNNSTPALIWKGTKTIMSVSDLDNTTLDVVYMVPFSIPAGECATFAYQYKDTSANGGTYHASVSVATLTPGTTFLPSSNFTSGSTSGLNGYDGTAVGNTTEDAVVPANTGCTQTPKPIATTVAINPTSTCAGNGNYVTATVTIQNPNTEPLPAGITLENLTQQLNLTGTGAKFSGEPYGFTNGLQMNIANTLDAAYPAVPNAIDAQSGTRLLTIQKLAPGTSTYKIDIAAGTVTFNLASTIINIPLTYNAGGMSATAQDATGVTINPAPAAIINCPAGVTAQAATLQITGTTTGTGGATPIRWSSNTNGTFTANGTSTNAAPDYNYTITDLDRAQGFVNLQLQVLSAAGCEATAYCQVPITGAQMDYGDLPSSYDFNGTESPVAAGAMNPTANMMLGTVGAGADATVKSSAKADGDGAEEDGIAAFNPITLNMTSYSVDVTYTSDVPATVCGWFDWNNNGHFDAGEGVCNAVTAQANGTTTLSWSNINGGAGANGGMLGYSRFRISSDNMNAYSFYGPTTNGEVEDYNILAVALPLNLLSFDAQKADGHAILNWATASEVHTSHFEVEASTNGTDYRALGRVQAAGNSEEKQQYTYRHMSPAAGRYYYRLKMVDQDGTFRYSGTRILHFSNQATFVLQPNPAGNQVRLDGMAENSSIKIMDAAGRTVLQQKLTGTATSLSLETLTPGHYQVVLYNAEGAFIGAQKLVKQ